MEAPGEDVVVRSVESVLEGGPTKLKSCPNCGSDRVESFCPSCGQRAGSLHTSIAAFAREMLDGFFSFDSRVWRTLIVLLLRPGHLTLEYWRGRRARFVAPLRLYLFVSFCVFLFLAAVAPQDVIDTSGQESGAMVSIGLDEDAPADLDDLGADSPPLVRWFVQRVLRPMIEEPERAGALFLQRLPWAFFFLVPAFAAQLRLLYRRQERFFVPHLVFALHFQTAAFLLYTVGIAVDAISGTEGASSLAGLVLLAFLFLSLWRAYGQGLLKTLAKQVGLLFVHSIVIMLAMLLLLVVTGLTA